MADRVDTISRVAGAALVAAFILGAAVAVLCAPFPSAYDEWQHLSLIAALRDAPAVFPAFETLRALPREGVAQPNYLAHPPLFYWAMGLLPFDPLVLRVADAMLASCGFALAVRGGLRMLAQPRERLVFLGVMLVFSKPALVAGLVNNDNLVMLETGALMAALAADRRRAWLMALILAAAGWTKLNAFLGLSALAGLALIFEGWPRRDLVWLAAGAALGAVPTLDNLLRYGGPLYVPVDFLFVAPADRLPVGPLGFAAHFYGKIGLKLFYVDGLIDLTALLPLLAAVAAGSARARSPMAQAAALASALIAALHLVYGWRSFETLGSFSDAQSRYYVMLWPAFSVAVAAGAGALVGEPRAAARPPVAAERPSA